MKLYQLIQFIAIAEHDTLRSAADSLFVSEPALSRSLAKLESELGCALFDRTPAGLKINEYGDVVLRRARLAVRETELMRSELESLKTCRSRPVRLASCHGDFCSLAGDFLARKHSRRSFQSIVVADGTELARMVRGGLCDIAFPTSSALDVSAMGIDSVKIYDEQVFLVAPLDAEEEGRVPMTPGEMRGLRYILPGGRGRGVDGWCERVVEAIRIPAGNITYIDIDHYTRNFNDIDGYSLATSTLLSFLKHDKRRLIAIADPCADESIFMSICSDDETVAGMAAELQAECGKGSGMNYFLAWFSTSGHSGNLEIVAENQDA